MKKRSQLKVTESYMLTVSRTFPERHELTRNLSFFKLKRFGQDEDNDPEGELKADGGIRADRFG